MAIESLNPSNFFKTSDNGTMSNPFELFWTEILSREVERVLAAYTPLSEEEKENVSAHLQRMVSEEGWHPEQVISARAALEAIQDE
jgi:hypothetical protein